MKKSVLVVLGIVVILLFAGVAGLLHMIDYGFRAKDDPMAMEKAIAQRMRYLSVPKSHRLAKNPVVSSPEVLARARAHFADHCSICHGNDGKGQTVIGRNLYPRAPDMQQGGTQELPDGHLFYIIKYGVRLTGMPGWGQDTPEDDRDTWELVHFIRHLPAITPQEVIEMEDLNPKSRSELKQEEEEARFLAGAPTQGVAPSLHHPKP